MPSMTQNEALQLLKLSIPFTEEELNKTFALVYNPLAIKQVKGLSPALRHQAEVMIRELQLAKQVLQAFVSLEKKTQPTLTQEQESQFIEWVILPKLHNKVLTRHEENEIYRMGKQHYLPSEQITFLIEKSLKNTQSQRQAIEEYLFIEMVILPKLHDKILTHHEEDEIYRSAQEFEIIPLRTRELIENALIETHSIRQGVEEDVFVELVILPKLFTHVLTSSAEQEIYRVGQQQNIKATAIREMIEKQLIQTGSLRGASAGSFAEVLKHPTLPNILGLQNKSHQPWKAISPEGSVHSIQPGYSITLEAGLKIGWVDGTDVS